MWQSVFLVHVMTTVSEAYTSRDGGPIFMCDYSPPRGADLSTVEQARAVGADFLCVAYSPGKSVRVDSAVMAYRIGQSGDQGVVFNLACRDMNKLALQNHLLGAQLLGLENVLVLQGDEFTGKDVGAVKNVSEYTSSGLIQAIASLNQGVDFRGLNLRTPTTFCVGAAINLGGIDMEKEAILTQRKITAGADFFITQALYDVGKAEQFLEIYRTLVGQEFLIPIFWGLQVLEKDGIIFGDLPEATWRDLESGRSGTDIALEQLHAYMGLGLTSVYIVPPILRGGRRNYQAAQEVVGAFRSHF